MRLPSTVAFAVILVAATVLTACDQTSHQARDITGNASILSESCNWGGVKNAVNWLQAPTVSNGKLTLWGTIDDPRANTTNWGRAPSGISYFSPFHIYGDCRQDPIATILPPLPGEQYLGP